MTILVLANIYIEVGRLIPFGGGFHIIDVHPEVYI